MEKKRRINAFIGLILLVGALFVGFALQTSASSVNEGMSVTSLRSATNIQSIEVMFHTEDRLYSQLSFDLGRLQSDTSQDGLNDPLNDYYSVEARSSMVHDGSYQVWFEGVAYVVLSVASQNSVGVRVAQDMSFDITMHSYGSVGSAPPTETIEDVSVYIDSILIRYGQNEIHPYRATSKFPHSGNSDSYIITNKSVNVNVTQTINYRHWTYTRRYSDSQNYDYSNLHFWRDTKTYQFSADLNGGCNAYRDYQQLSADAMDKNIIMYIKDGESSIQSLQSQYQYLIVDGATTLLQFADGTMYDFDITLYDWYDSERSGDYQVLPPYLNNYPQVMTDFNFGTFLRENVQAFLGLELMPNFSLGDVIFTVFGILVMIALFMMLAGK